MKIARWMIPCLLLLQLGCQKTDFKKALLSDDPAIRLPALGKLSEKSADEKSRMVPFLITLLDSNDPRVVERAEDALKTLGKAAVPALSSVLNNPNPYLRLSATEILGTIGVHVPGVVQLLTQALGDAHPLVREQAGLSLGRSKETLGLLVLALEDKNQAVRDSATHVLKLLDSPETRKAIEEYKSRS